MKKHRSHKGDVKMFDKLILDNLDYVVEEYFKSRDLREILAETEKYIKALEEEIANEGVNKKMSHE